MEKLFKRVGMGYPRPKASSLLPCPWPAPQTSHPPHQPRKPLSRARCLPGEPDQGATASHRRQPQHELALQLMRGIVLALTHPLFFLSSQIQPPSPPRQERSYTVTPAQQPQGRTLAHGHRLGVLRLLRGRHPRAVPARHLRPPPALAAGASRGCPGRKPAPVRLLRLPPPAPPVMFVPFRSARRRGRVTATHRKRRRGLPWGRQAGGPAFTWGWAWPWPPAPSSAAASSSRRRGCSGCAAAAAPGQVPPTPGRAGGDSG